MSTQTVPEHMKWWVDARFGMFIHWGVYSIPSRGEWVLYQEHMTNDEYARLADEFDPRSYRPAEWVKLAADAGMKYVVLTTRHHDGFCLFDSKVSDFTAPKTAAGRDLIAEFAEACHSAGMRMGFYYSLVDWRFPGILPPGTKPYLKDWEPMVEQAHAQVREILTNYGKVDILWYDGCNPHDPDFWRSQELNAMARDLQPDIIINNRAALPADYGTPENRVIAEQRPWEACYTMNDSWGNCATDRNYKSPKELLHLLISCVSQSGNLLLNVGPDRDGVVPAEATERLARHRPVDGDERRGYPRRGNVTCGSAGAGVVNAQGRFGLPAHHPLAGVDRALRLVRRQGPRGEAPWQRLRDSRRAEGRSCVPARPARIRT